MKQEFDTPGDALAHYGVKGMRWGRRTSDKSRSSTPTNATKTGDPAVGGGRDVKAQVAKEVKGVKWGTREAYLHKTEVDARRLRNINAGKAGPEQRIFAAKDLVFTKKQSEKAAPMFERHAERIRKGQVKTADILLLSARLRRRDLTIGMDLAQKRTINAEKRGKDPDFRYPEFKKMTKQQKKLEKQAIKKAKKAEK